MTESEAHHVAVLARRLRLLVWAAIAVSTALYVGARLEARFGHLRIVTEGADSLPLSLARDVGAVLVVTALWRVTAMLRLIEAGDRFSPAVTRCFRSFALFLFLSAAVALIAPLLAVLIVSDAHPRMLQLPLSFRDIWIMLVTGVLLLVARLLDEAQRIESDLREIV